MANLKIDQGSFLLTHPPFFLGFVHRLKFLKHFKTGLLEAGFASSSGKCAPNLVDYLDHTLLRHWVPGRHSTCFLLQSVDLICSQVCVETS